MSRSKASLIANVFPSSTIVRLTVTGNHAKAAEKELCHAKRKPEGVREHASSLLLYGLSIFESELKAAPPYEIRGKELDKALALTCFIR